MTILYKVLINTFTSSICCFVLSVPIGPPVHSKVLFFRLLPQCIDVHFLFHMYYTLLSTGASKRGANWPRIEGDTCCTSSQTMSKATRTTPTHPSAMSAAARATAPGPETREREETGGKSYFDGYTRCRPILMGTLPLAPGQSAEMT